MQNFLKKYIAGLFLFSIVIVIATFINQVPNSDIKPQTAAIFDPLTLPADAKQASGFAWSDTVGWINFGDESSDPTGRVYVSNNKLYGFAWGENIGWISMNCANTEANDCTTYGVTQNDSDGVLTGFAWGENIGWIDFAPSGGGVFVSTSTSGTNILTGYAWGENIGWISFSGSSPDYGVTTEWIAEEILISAITPANYRISKNDTTTFSATVTGRENDTVLWSIEAGAGTIDGNGLYTASNVDGDYTLTATASVDPSVSTTTTVTIRISTPIVYDCTYNEAEWGVCIDGNQTRELIPSVTPCTGENPKIETRVCGTIATTTPITVSISPASSTILVGDKIQFAVQVTGTTTTGINWIVFPIEDDNYYGAIDNNGLYTSPDNIGNLTFLNVQIIATSQADNSKTTTATIRVERKPLCTAYTYSDWSTCINSSQTRNTLTSIPAGCVGGAVASTTQACIMPPIATTTSPCVSYTYSNWSDCLNNKQTRTTLSSNPENCIGGTQSITEQSCTVENNIITGDLTDTNISESNTTDTDSSNNSSGHSSSRKSSEDKTENKIVALLDVSSIVTNNIAVLGTTTEKIVLGAKKVLESPTGDAVAKTITTVGVVGGGVAVSSAIAMNGAAAADIFFMPFKLWGLLLSILGLKKRNRPWGTVYDSVTKQPIDPAYVMLKNLKTGKEEMSITDLDGRYGFLVSKGTYVLSANKTNYLFPSKKLAGKTADALYSNLYFGEELNIENPSVLLSKNIPLDPLKFDWNEFTKGQKKLMKFYSQKEKIIRIITDWLFRIGFLISLISLFLVSAPYNLIIFGLYLVIYSLRKIGLRQKALGSITTKTGDPLSFAIVRVFDAELKVEITNKVADKIGRYYCLVNKGKYYIKVEKKTSDEDYTEVFTSPVFEAKEGIVNKSFII